MIYYELDRLPHDLEDHVLAFLLRGLVVLSVLVGIMGVVNVFQRRTTLKRLMCYLAAGVLVMLMLPTCDFFFPFILLFPFAMYAILYAVGGCVACLIERCRQAQGVVSS
jgi:predicted membrane channel-forming protein YqfA (hemolysin III family)